MRTSLLVPALFALLLVACRAERASQVAARADRVAAPVGIIDSILPIAELQRRFRAGLTEPTALGGRFASSRESLVAALLDAVRASDSVAVAAMTLDRAEFSWLYYPAHIYARPPYELAPATFWTLIEGGSDKGKRRLLQRLGGIDFTYRGMQCEPSTNVRAPVQEWQNCRVKLLLGGAPQELRIFGSIVAVEGRYKFAGYANDF